VPLEMACGGRGNGIGGGVGPKRESKKEKAGRGPKQRESNQKMGASETVARRGKGGTKRTGKKGQKETTGPFRPTVKEDWVSKTKKGKKK